MAKVQRERRAMLERNTFATMPIHKGNAHAAMENL